MDAYEFTRPQNNYLGKVSSRVKGYDANMLVRNIIRRNPDKDVRNLPKYKDAYNTYIDLTMSCTTPEAIQQCRYWMANAVAYGEYSHDNAWVFFFLAAYDLCDYLRTGE